jgi:hypothetical protein
MSPTFQLHIFTWDRNEVVEDLGRLDDRASRLTTRVPMQVLTDIDNGRNPMHLTKDRLERAATENQFMNGKIKAIEVRIIGSCTFQGTLMSTVSALVSRAIGSCLMRRLCRRFPISRR